MNASIAVDHEIVVIGGGFSGIGAAIKLKEAGFTDFVVVDEADGVGGTWHWNTYPGVAVDIPSFSYQFSFEKRSDWSRVYAPGRELKAYADHCVDKYGVRDRFRLNTRVTGASFDEDANIWVIGTEGGEPITARFVIGATGVFCQPKPPAIPGVESFAGATVHTARWDHSVDLRGKRVAVIGTGASAIQVIPAIAPEVDQLTVFQRTPIWCLPKLDAPIGARARAFLRWVPGAMLAARWLSQAFVELTFVLVGHFAGKFPFLPARGEAEAMKLLGTVEDPAVREKLTPHYRLGCKRPSFSNEYIQTFNRENVRLETSTIESITPAGVRTADGVEHPVDVLVLATGFKADAFMRPMQITGRGGRTLADEWSARPSAYLSVSIPDFPNFFMLNGPNGPVGNFSLIEVAEIQFGYVVQLVDKLRAGECTEISATRDAMERHETEREAAVPNTVWVTGCKSWYLDDRGIPAVWPWGFDRFREVMRAPQPAAFETR
jgi:cation diffusion facilitator CzcD-associated flavoprotein CzcO